MEKIDLTMRDTIESIKVSRKILLELVNVLSLEELNLIPAGFNNNVISNIGHLVAAQQGICYLRAGLLPVVEDKIVSEFKPGTKPEKDYNSPEIESIKQIAK